MQQLLGGQFAHAMQGLAHRRERGVLVGGGMDVVEADDGDVVRDADAGLVQRADAADGGDVVEGEDGGEAGVAREDPAHGEIAGLVGGAVGLQFVDGGQRELHLFGDGADGLPADFGVGAEALPFDDGDGAMAECAEVPQREFRGANVVEDDVGGDGVRVRAGDGDGGQLAGAREGGVDGDEAVDGALGEHGLRLLHDLGAVVVGDEDEDVSGLEEDRLKPGEHQGDVALGHLWNEDADGHGAAPAQGAGEQVGAVVQFLRCGENALLRGQGDGACGGGPAEYARDGCLGETKMGRQRGERCRPLAVRIVHFLIRWRRRVHVSSVAYGTKGWRLAVSC